MVRGSYVKGTSFVGVNSSENEDVVMKDVKERLTCPHLRIMSTERLTCPLSRNTEHVKKFLIRILRRKWYIMICTRQESSQSFTIRWADLSRKECY